MALPEGYGCQEWERRFGDGEHRQRSRWWEDPDADGHKDFDWWEEKRLSEEPEAKEDEDA